MNQFGSVSRLAAFIAGRRGKYVVLALWALGLVAAAGLAGKLASVQHNDMAATLPAAAESTRVVEIQSSFASSDTLAAVVVYERPGGLTDADRTKLAADARVFGERDDLGGAVVGPTVASDGKAAQIIVPLDLGPDSFTRASGAVSAIRQTAQRDANGLAVYITGPAGATADQSQAVAGIDTTLLLATVVVVVVILLLTYRSPVLWLLPVLSAGAALTGAQAVLYLLARYANLTVTADSGAILTILVFGAATDYALLLVARYREELHRHEDRHHAMAAALRRCTPAIVASAGTVIAAMLCLLLADMRSTKGLGPVLAIGVAVALAVMVTAFPALLTVAGRWVFWPARPTYGPDRRATSRWWTRVGHGIARRPRLTWIATALALGALTLGVAGLQATGLTAEQSFRGTHDSVVGEEALTRHFAGGAGAPIAIVSNPDRAEAVRAAVAAAPGVDPSSLTPTEIHANHAYLEATLTDPADSRAAFDTVDRVRAAVHAVPDADALVGGGTAIQLDIERSARHDRLLLLPIVFAVVFAILMILLRSLVAPLVLIGTVLLSFGAALGASTLVFHRVFGFGGEDSSLPLYVFVFLVALGVDYNIFLMSRVREEAAQHGTRKAMVTGLAVTGAVITSAGLVLAGTFAVLTTIPLTVVTELGFAVAFGILLDTTVVRSVLVTALTLDIGRHMWWPSRLNRVPDPPRTRDALSAEPSGSPRRDGSPRR